MNTKYVSEEEKTQFCANYFTKKRAFYLDIPLISLVWVMVYLL